MALKEEKKQIVNEITDKLKKSKEVVIVDYRGLSVKDMAELRSNLREAGVDFKIYKNTLIRLAADKSGKKELDSYLTGPTAIAFDYQDEVTTPKILVNFSKDHRELEVKGGLLEDNLIDASQIKALASMLSKEELIAKVVSTVAGPIRNLAYVLNGPMQNFGSVIRQLAES